MHDVHAAQCLAHAFAVGDVAVDELNVLGPGGVFPNIEHLHAFTAFGQPPRDEVAQETGAAGDKVGLGSGRRLHRGG